MRFLGGRLHSAIALLLVAGCRDYTCADTASCVGVTTPSSPTDGEAGAPTSALADGGTRPGSSDSVMPDADAGATGQEHSSDTEPAQASTSLGAPDSTAWQDASPPDSAPAGSTSVSVNEGSSTEAWESTAASSSSTVPSLPPVTTGQSADLVLGQSNFETVTPGNGDSMFSSASALSSDGAHLWVLDLANSRVVQFNAQPIGNKQEADLAIGQLSLLEYTDGPASPHLKKPTDFYKRDTMGDVHSDGQVLAVADGANRVLLWHAIPTAHGARWDVILGQGDDSSDQSGLTASTLNGPEGVWTDGEKVVVADSLNHRVLIWQSFPTVSGQPADLVLGQADFESKVAPDPPTATSMNHPSDVVFDGERLFVSDSKNNRVMVWNQFPTESNTPADYAVGQGSLATGNCHAGAESANQIGLCEPGQLTFAGGNLFVADRANFRVVVHAPLPEMSGVPAVSVLGAADFTGTAVAEPQKITPRGVAVFGAKLFVSDSSVASGRSRVLRYQLGE